MKKTAVTTESLEGAQNYATLRSIIDTSRKRGLNEFEVLKTVIEGEFCLLDGVISYKESLNCS